MSSSERVFSRVMGWVVTLLTPYAVIRAAIHLLFSSVFLQLEYHAPGFPADPYGFTLADRLHWSRLSLDYLLNSAGISFVTDMKFADGTPIYNAREVSHMQDVKNLVQSTLHIWYAVLAVLVLLAVVAVWRRWGREYLKGLSRGGWLTVGLIVLVLVGVAVSFTWLFTEFHRVFFTGDSWLFYYSDTFIRLFPMRFWEDGFTVAGIVSLVTGLLLGILLRPTRGSEPAAGTAQVS
ncbi:MAG TPA: TIGR01906 family membrane protein [Anaerolineaceae bacterium]